MARPVLECSIQGLEQGAGGPQRRHGVGLDQRLDHATVEHVEVDAPAEVVERHERPGLRSPIADGDDRVDRALADVLDRRQAEADRLGRAGGIGLDREEGQRLLHVRRTHLDPQPAALGDDRGDLLGALAEAVHDRGHELDRVVRLQVGRLVGDEPVAGGVGLVEAVSGEGLELGEDLVDDVRRDALLLRAGLELRLVLAEDVLLLLADRVAEVVRLGAGVIGHRDGRGHDVFLVDEDPVRVPAAPARATRGGTSPAPRRACGGCRRGCSPSVRGGRGRPWRPGRAPRSA